MATGQEIYETFMAGDIGPLQAAEDLVMAIAQEFEQEAQDLDDAQKQLLGYWEGDAADMAGIGVDPLKDAHMQSAPMIIEAGGSVRTQQDVYSWGKQNVEPVPPEPKEPSAFSRGAAAILPGVDDPDVAYREGMERTDAANSNNVRVMDQYTNVTGDTSSKLPSDYGIVEDDGASISIGTHTSSAGGGGGVGSPGFGSSGLTPGGGGGSGVGGLPGGGPSFGGGPGGGLPGSGPGGGGPGPAPVPPGGVPGSGPGPGLRPGPIGIAPIGPVTGSPGEDSRRPARGGAGTRPPAGSARAGARMSGGTQSGSGAGAGKASSVLRGGAAAQARLSGGTAGLQAGKDAGAMPGAGAGGAAAAKAAGGIGGRGAGGMGAGGAGGQRGQGAEDGEHKDKYALKEELDDGLQVEFDELGAKTIDEKTGNTVVSPVIGEPGDGK